jgi:hypothetical protein
MQKLYQPTIYFQLGNQRGSLHDVTSGPDARLQVYRLLAPALRTFFG